MNIFVSYTLRDGILDEGRLQCLYLALKQSGDPYVDILHNTGSNRQAYVVEQLNRANVLVACVTKGFFASEWVQFELITAKERGIPIVALNMQPECHQKQFILLKTC